jgi:hypothetical protein
MFPDAEDNLAQKAFAIGGQLLVGDTPIDHLIHSVIGGIDFKEHLERGDPDAVT